MASILSPSTIALFEATEEVEERGKIFVLEIAILFSMLEEYSTLKSFVL
jgi:hypothetical protein